MTKMELFNIKVSRIPEGYKIWFKASEKLRGLINGKASKVNLFEKELQLFQNHRLLQSSTNSVFFMPEGVNGIILYLQEAYGENGLEIISKDLVPIEKVEKDLKSFGRSVAKIYKDHLKPINFELILKESEVI